MLDTLFNGLHRLEYRGYDSSGIAVDIIDAYPLSAAKQNSEGDVITEENGAHDTSSPLIVKEVGKVAELEKLVASTIAAQGIETSREFKNQVAISHTRWATHGPPCAVNSHPHVSDPLAEFVVVHNGIITNYKLLKDFLVRSRWKQLFCSDGQNI